ncbi:hypothetical protein [Sphingomonas sp.]|jgi:hypothetical protein|uniref:hypothetical protein n=1 Tax=Sphingomonas sp. TaxID=28214 RepID=UPI002D7FEB3A|nr:hypothetical protein [Sphingomonas sp.]HEU0044322.1 hypothetical protein [Sphingomonas sp.]
MKTFLSSAALAALFIPATAFAQAAEQRFTRDGMTYVYTVTPAAKGRQVIEGHRLPSGSAFRLVVNGKRVDGMSGGQPVSFRTPKPSATLVAAR